MQLYQIATNSSKTQQLLAETNAVLRHLGISAAVLAQPAIQAQLSQAIIGMGAVSQYGLDITVTAAGGAQ
jgi:hypothetical protein